MKTPIDVSVTYANPFYTLNIVAMLIFATYPLFLYLGVYAGNKISQNQRAHSYDESSTKNVYPHE